MTATHSSGRIRWSNASYRPRPMSGPMTAPQVSRLRWNPNARPRSSGVVSSAMSESRGAPRIPLPIRSPTRATSTIGHTTATAMASFATAAIPYPSATIGRRARRSAKRPETSRVMAAAPSARPSTSPTTATGAPRMLTRKMASTG